MLPRSVQPKRNIYQQKEKKRCTGIREKERAFFFFRIFCCEAIPTLSSITILLSLQPVPEEVSVNKVDLFNTIRVAFVVTSSCFNGRDFSERWRRDVDTAEGVSQGLPHRSCR